MKYLACDIEANNWIDFLLLGQYDGKEYKEFYTVNEWIDNLSNYNGYRIYFHNGGRYDFLFLIEPLMDKYTLDFISSETSLIAIKIKELAIEIVDSYKLLPASLEKLISNYNINETKIQIDFTKKLSVKNKKLREHLKNDCIALYKIIEKVCNQYGNLKYTIASQSLEIFRKRFFNGSIYEVTNNQDIYFRTNYYRGGRVEVIRGYGKNLYYYDINSLYPFVMLNQMPVSVPIKTRKFVDNKIGFYHIRLEKDTDFKITPLMHKTKNGLYYVNGIKGNDFYISSAELKIAYDLGVRFKIISGNYFEKSDYLFNEFVNHYYEIKKNAKTNEERYFAKLLLNSLYGKFGQKLNGSKIIRGYQPGAKIYDAENDLFIIDEKRHIKFKGVYIAAYITSLARTELLKYIYEIGENNIWYFDTDSIVTNKKIETGNEIGQLKLVDKITEAVFIAPKTYAYINDNNNIIIKNKGFTENAFSFNDMKNLLLERVDKLVYETERILGFKECIRRKNDIIKDNGKYLKLVKMEKVLQKNYNRRILIKSKKYIFDSKPFQLTDLLTK